MDYRLKDRMQAEQALEFVWDGLPGLDSDRQVRRSIEAKPLVGV